MSIRSMILILGALVAILFFAFSGTAKTETITAPDGRTRTYEIFVPQKIRGQAAATLFVLHGGGHTVPSTKKPKKTRKAKFRRRLLGPTNRDFNAQKMIVTFLGL